MITVYVYILDTLADWEMGYAAAELNSKRFFKKDAPNISVKTVGISKEPVKTMGGLTIIPDCVISDIAMNEESVLLLPGANTWGDPIHGAIIDKASHLLSAGGTVCAICGATAALANVGLLDQRLHTSNGMGYLEMVSPCYKGQQYYVDKPSVADQNLITASSTAANLQPVHLIAVQSGDGLAKIGKAADIYGAPLAIIVCADRNKAWVRPFDQKQTGDIDASILTDHMMLQAAELGLGSVWVCCFKPDVLCREFGLPANLEPVNILV